MILTEIALRVINNPDEFKFEDYIEAMQFLNDTGQTHLLNDSQKVRLWAYVENGLVLSAPVKL